MFSRVLKFALIGGVLGCIAAVLMFGKSNVQGNDPKAMLALMVPAFGVSGMILGALNAVLFSILDKFRK